MSWENLLGALEGRGLVSRPRVLAELSELGHSSEELATVASLLGASDEAQVDEENDEG